MKYEKTGKVVGISHRGMLRSSSTTELKVLFKDGDDSEIVNLNFNSKAFEQLCEKGFPQDEKTLKSKKYKVKISIKDYKK